ncbi:hypothetical protein [Aeromonas salmonicida]
MPCPYGVIIFNNYLYSFGGYNWQQCHRLQINM